MTTEAGEMLTESALFTVTDAVFDVACTATLSVTFRQTVYGPAEDGVNVHAELVAPETALPSKYH
jgi:hypothetical protein